MLQPFTYFEPQIKSAPIFVASPHSGRHIPLETLNNTILSQFELRKYEDFYMDEISNSSYDLGLGFIKAEYSRIYIDLNRSPTSLDYLLIDGAKPKFDCPYTKIGIGLIPRLLDKNIKIHINKINLSEAVERINKIHGPYHEIIFGALHNLEKQFGRALLIDMHSMPARALGELEGDIVIGNRFGQSCDLELTNIAKKFFQENGLKVRLNHPFAGGYSTIFHANKKKNIFALQIEINRKLYFNEEEQIKSKDFENIKNIIEEFFKYMIVKI